MPGTEDAGGGLGGQPIVALPRNFPPVAAALVGMGGQSRDLRDTGQGAPSIVCSVSPPRPLELLPPPGWGGFGDHWNLGQGSSPVVLSKVGTWALSPLIPPDLGPANPRRLQIPEGGAARACAAGIYCRSGGAVLSHKIRRWDVLTWDPEMGPTLQNEEEWGRGTELSHRISSERSVRRVASQ